MSFKFGHWGSMLCVIALAPLPAFAADGPTKLVDPPPAAVAPGDFADPGVDDEFLPPDETAALPPPARTEPNYGVTSHVVPEPASVGLLSLAAVTALLRRRRPRG